MAKKIEHFKWVFEITATPFLVALGYNPTEKDLTKLLLNGVDKVHNDDYYRDDLTVRILHTPSPAAIKAVK